LNRNPAGYFALLEDIKLRIRTAQIKAALSVNRELIELYWSIGRDIALRQEAEGWGKGIIDRLADDIRREFPGIEGFSPSNISRMRAFYIAWKHGGEDSAQPVPNLANSNSAQAVPNLNPPEAVLQIPWGHNVALIFKLGKKDERLWYAQQTTANGWSRSMLVHWIESDLYSRQGKSINNFKTTLPAAQSDLANELLKDPYNFDFLTLATDAAERELEQGLLDHIRKFLIELGIGFAFVGQQVPIEVDGEGYSIDLLFYHLRLRCFIVVDLKTEPFSPFCAHHIVERRTCR
jgi:predicted nuclease of restriction endonuclease-like (RecB) superfamily